MLASLLAALDNRRAEFLAGLDSVPSAQRALRPSPSAWSPLEIGEHLLLVEDGLGRFIARQIERGEARKRFDPPSERSVEGLLRALRTPARFKVPDGVPGIVPQGEVSEADLRRDWQASAERWREIARAVPPELETEAVAMHAVAGPLTVAQTLRFLEAHTEHHLHQLARTARALNAEPPTSDGA